jgi:hypothetical protein
MHAGGACWRQRGGAVLRSGQVSGRCPLAFPGASLLANSLRPRDTAGVPVSMRVRGHAPMRPRRDGVRGLRQSLLSSSAHTGKPDMRVSRRSGRPDMREREGGGAPEGATNSALMRRGARFGRARTPPGAPPRRSLSSPSRRSPAPGRASRRAFAPWSASSSRPARSGQAGGAPGPPGCPADETGPAGAASRSIVRTSPVDALPRAGLGIYTVGIKACQAIQ